MVAPIKQLVTVQEDGTILIRSSLQPGTRAEVTILPQPPLPKRSLSSFFGTGKGLFATPQDVDKYIREERDSWDR